MFTQAQLNAMFHTMNNSYGDAFEIAIQRAIEVEGMTRDEFIRAYTSALTILGNISEDDFKRSTNDYVP